MVDGGIFQRTGLMIDIFRLLKLYPIIDSDFFIMLAMNQAQAQAQGTGAKLAQRDLKGFKTHRF